MLRLSETRKLVVARRQWNLALLNLTLQQNLIPVTRAAPMLTHEVFVNNGMQGRMIKASPP